MTTKHDHCLLLSLPLELREKIYLCLFVNVFARKYKTNSSQPLAILQTSTKVHDEASSVLFQRTPLRFMIGHLQPVSSIPPPRTIIDRFQNIFFKMVRMNTVRSDYDFANPFARLTEAFTQSSVRRRNCYIQCELEDHASGYCGELLQDRVKTFTGFETLTIDFEGKVLKTEFPQGAVADDDPRKDYKLYMQGLREAARRREYASLTDAEEMFRTLEAYLGKGEMLDAIDGFEGLYIRRLMFHPIQHATRTQQ